MSSKEERGPSVDAQGQRQWEVTLEAQTAIVTTLSSTHLTGEWQAFVTIPHIHRLENKPWLLPVPR